MASDGVPEEYLDVVFQEFAYDPVRLPHAEDPAQLLYNRRTLETIWVTKHEAINPYTRQPFHINNVIPQTELRQEMHRYITRNRIPGLQVIPDYTKLLNQTEMTRLLKDLVSHYQKKNGKKEEAYWKVLWQKLNLIRLYCQYGKWNRELFSLIQGYQFLFKVVDTQLQSSYSLSEESREVCREVGRIVDIVGLIHRDLLTIPENSILAFVHILYYLGKSKYLKIQSMVLKIYYQMFYHNINYPLLNDGATIVPCVIGITLKLLGRHNSRDEIINEDLYNGTGILKAAWTWRSLTLLHFDNYVDVVVKVVILCISRYEEQLLSSPQGGAHCIGKALNRGLELIETLLKAEESEVYEYVKQKKRLQELDIVKDIVGMVEHVVAGVRFKSSHVQFGLIITAELLKTGRRKLRQKEIDVFADFLQSDAAKKYSTHVRQLLRNITTMAASMYYKAPSISTGKLYIADRESTG